MKTGETMVIEGDHFDRIQISEVPLPDGRRCVYGTRHNRTRHCGYLMPAPTNIVLEQPRSLAYKLIERRQYPRI